MRVRIYARFRSGPGDSDENARADDRGFGPIEAQQNEPERRMDTFAYYIFTK